jgi:hypothetical protein
MQNKDVYFAVHDDGEPVKFTACHSVVLYETEQDAEEDNPKNIILKGHWGETVGGEKVLLNSLNEIIY